MFYFIGFFQNIVNAIPEEQRVIFNLIVFTILILFYSLFIWEFYRLLARRDIIELNLSKYNYSKHPVLEKLYAVGLYILEYLVILPFLIIFWFSILSIFLLVLSELKNTSDILLIASAIIASTRIASYINEDLSSDIAKIFPFTVLVFFVLSPNFFNYEKIFNRMMQIPSLFNYILTFLIFIFIIEFIFRSLDLIVELIRSKEN